MALMVDKPRKASRLLAALKAAVPFEVELAPTLIEYLQAENLADADRKKHVVSDLSYAGEGGIVCLLFPSKESGRNRAIDRTRKSILR
jgi:hypothetical protein